ncbi:DUF3048 domain-containing protein [Pontibacillus yanchengensis]|uniref:DUF3048 domain-containing protein n=1 Tax=Pontibacillus yanchengensis TaxID=462910 RepID=A0A6I5A6Z6_9BACI|nr:DUF3048 domain-containing protein [Pontibacillus yanchengensis]MYL36103.1 DUF3048 domain-containing protein [Pontibacillus yanchengensis]
MMYKRLILLFLLAFPLILAACADNSSREAQNVETIDRDETNVQKEEDGGNTKEEKQKQEPVYQNMYPLTGEPTNEDVDDRIVAVMVNNHSFAQPQTGLTKADMVYEVLAEGQITRFVAFFHSDMPDVVGPVRSAREYYINIAKGYNALYLYHGAATYIENQLKQGWIDHLNGMYYDDNGTLFKRESFRNPPHNSYLQMDGVYKTAEAKGMEVEKNHKPLPFLSDQEVEGLSGEAATDVKITYSTTPQETVTYKYDKTSKKYVRYSDGDKTIDRETEEPMTVDNVFIVETGHEIIDNVGRRAVDLDSGGSGYLLQRGKMQEVQWKNVNGRILPYKDGKKLGFVPGKTWVNIIPERPGIQQSVNMSAQ